MGRSTWLRRIAHGLLAGAILSCLRAPLGLDWTQVVVVQGSTAALFRAAALVAIALSLRPERNAFRRGLGAGWLAAVCAGYAVFGLVLDLAAGSRAGLALALVAGTLLLRALAGKHEPAGPPATPELSRDGEIPGRREHLGLLLAGLGLALALEPLAHEVRLFTLATRADASVVGAVFLGLLALGAASFGPLLGRVGSERARVSLGLAWTAASVLAGLVLLRGLGPNGLHGYLRRFDPVIEVLRGLDRALGERLGIASVPTLDGASIGTLWTTAILSAAALVGPGLLLGATLGATRRAERAAPALLGAALGLVLLPALVRAQASVLTEEQCASTANAWNHLALGAAIAALGALLVASAGRSGRTGTVALALGAAAVPWLRPHFVLWNFSPWSASIVHPLLVTATPEGVLTVENARDGGRIVTLDRQRLTPTRDEEGGDERWLRYAWERLPERPPGTTVRGLLVGQLTPARARVLRSLPALELDRTAPWYASMAATEELLFEGEEAPPGRIVSPARARSDLKAGQYQWVVVPPIHGPLVAWKSEAREIWAAADAPRLTGLELERGVTGIVWFGSDALAPRGVEFEPVSLGIDRLETLSFALQRGEQREPDLESGPSFRVSFVEGPSPLTFLRTMPQHRALLLDTAWSSGLRSESMPGLVRGLRLHFAAQRFSSPYETRPQQIELDEDALRAFFEDVPEAGHLDRLTRELWETLAWLITEKRMPELALPFLEPLAERFQPWPALDLAVGHAYHEMLDPETALGFLERARREHPGVVQIYLEEASCQQDLERPEEAVGLLRMAQSLDPGNPGIQRLLGLALVRAGHPEGRPILDEILFQNPEDEEVREALLESLGPPGPPSGETAPEGR